MIKSMPQYQRAAGVAIHSYENPKIAVLSEAK
jgi:hypothetical protein